MQLSPKISNLIWIQWFEMKIAVCSLDLGMSGSKYVRAGKGEDERVVLYFTSFLHITQQPANKKAVKKGDL